MSFITASRCASTSAMAAAIFRAAIEPPSSRARKRCTGTRNTRESTVARPVAERASAVTSDISPSTSPAPRRASERSPRGPRLMTSSSPATTR